MNRSLFWLAALLGAGTVVGCDGKDDGIEDEESDADTDADSDADTDADADADTDADSDADFVFEPAAVGFEYFGGWDEGEDDLLPYYYEDKPYGDYVWVTVTDIDYFSAKTEEEQEAHSCRVAFYFDDAAPSSFEAEGYENGEPAELWAAYEGSLTFAGYATTKYSACGYADPATWPDVNGDKYPDEWAPFEGMHFGLGFGPLEDSEYMMGLFDEKTLKEISDYAFATYIAINHPTGDGGYDFIGYDWGYGFLYEWDPETHEISVDDKGYLVPANVGDPVLSGHVRTYPYWYEDYPNIDFSLLYEGVE